jgi:hypothetical protein
MGFSALGYRPKAAALLALCTGIFGLASAAEAACRIAKTPVERQQLAEDIARQADVIVVGRIIRKFDSSKGVPEKISVERVLKGKVGSTLSLWMPTAADSLNTNEAPTTGLPIGRTAVMPLRFIRTKNGRKLIVFECDAPAIFDPITSSLVSSSLTK